MKKDTLKGKVFCFTGTLDKPRKMYREFVEGLGGEVVETVTPRVTAVVYGSSGYTTAKERRAEELDVMMISERTLFAMAGMTLEEFGKYKRAARTAERLAYETSYQGKWDRLKASALVSIGKLGNAMKIPGASTRIYVHYRLKARTYAALIKCISANGVVFTDRNGKSQFHDWNTVAPMQLMEVADYLAKLKASEDKSFCRRLILLNREAERLGQLTQLMTA